MATAFVAAPIFSMFLLKIFYLYMFIIFYFLSKN